MNPCRPDRSVRGRLPGNERVVDEMKEALLWFALVVLVVVMGFAIFYQIRKPGDQPAPEVVVQPTEPAPVVPEPVDEPLHPVPEPVASEEPAIPLLPIDESDAATRQSLSDAFGAESVAQFLVPESVIRHIVATVDNLPREELSEELRPVKATPGRFQVSGSEEAPMLDPANYARYDALVQLLDSTDTARIAALYFQLYPLFQQAYVELGYPDQYFNDRLVEVIDHLLATPDIQGPIRLTRPKVLYQYADENIEERSAGQKLLIRIGPANAAVAKAKLREIRSEVSGHTPAP